MVPSQASKLSSALDHLHVPVYEHRSPGRRGMAFCPWNTKGRSVTPLGGLETQAPSDL